MTTREQMSQLFVEEATELLLDFEQALLLLESRPGDTELLNRIFRGAHTLKGNATILSLEPLTTLTHGLESLLDLLRQRELAMTRGVADTLLASLDLLKALVAELAGGPAHDARALAQLRVRIDALLPQARPALIVSELPPLSELMPSEPAISRAPPRATATQAAPSTSEKAPHAEVGPAITPHTMQRSDSLPLRKELTRRPDEPGASSTVRERRPGANESEANSVRVPIEKLDRLINLTGEVVIAQSMIAQLITDLTPDNLSLLQEVVAQMDRHCRELQERMLGARMLPIKSVFARFNRLVRDLSASTGKSLQLELTGEETELDKTVIEKISDPLTHLVRNAIDHGIENTEERRRSGKSERAKISLAAYQKGGSIFIDVSDDGRGLNRDKILKKARSAGLIAEDARLSDDEANLLIFQPGFSTADAVTEISGRGVGMDVVKRNVEALRGSITITTTPGQGTCFRIKLPLTLAILDGLGLRVGPQVYLVPLVSVVESLQPRATDVRTVADLGEVVDVRGEYLPLLRLHELLGVRPVHEAAHHGLVMVLDDGVQRIAVQIDELIGQYQVVIKSLDTNFQSVPGIAGATILGDGSVALILDTANLITLARSHSKRARSERAALSAHHLNGGSA